MAQTNKRLWGLNEVVEANLRRKNESKSIKGKKSRKAHRSRVQSRLNEIAEWDAFYDALETVADDTAEKASPEEVSEDQPMEEVAEVVESSDSSSDSDTLQGGNSQAQGQIMVVCSKLSLIP